MKSKLLLFIFAGLLTASTSVAQWAYFPFDENVTDENGNLQATLNGTNGSFVEDPARGGVLQLGGGTSTDAAAAYLTVQTGVIDHDEVTINLWFQWNDVILNPSNETDSWWQRIFDFGDTEASTSGTNHDVYFLTTQGNANPTPTMQWNIHKGNADEWPGGADTILIVPEKLEYDVWYMVTCVHNSDSAKLYLDGELVDAKAVGGMGPGDFEFTNTFFGKSNWADNLFWGKFDDLRIYNASLTDAEIDELYVVPSSIRDENKGLDAQIFAYGNLLRIALENPIQASVNVYNLQGMEVYSAANLNEFTEITGLEAGFYLVKVQNGNGTKTGKVFISE